MSTTTIESTPTDTQHRIETDAERTKFLRRVLREDGWRISASASEDWQFTFHRTIKGKVGDPNVDITVRIKDKLNCGRNWGSRKSFSDSDEVIVPMPSRVWLTYGSVQTSAKFLLEGCQFLISGSSGSTNSSKHGLAFVAVEVMMRGGCDSVVIGHQSVYVHGKMVCCGSVE